MSEDLPVLTVLPITEKFPRSDSDIVDALIVHSWHHVYIISVTSMCVCVCVCAEQTIVVR